MRSRTKDLKTHVRLPAEDGTILVVVVDVVLATPQRRRRRRRRRNGVGHGATGRLGRRGATAAAVDGRRFTDTGRLATGA